MAIWNEVKGLRDGQFVDAETFNRPIGELTARTDYLKNRLDELGDGHSSLQIQVLLSESDTPSVGDVVCVDPETKRYRKAIASMDLYDAYTASEKAYAVGLLISKTDMTGTVVLYGRVDIHDLDVGSMSDETFMSGQYYLSSSTPGKITRFPTGPRILVGFFAENTQVNGTYSGSFAIINPQHMDIEAHSHRTYVLEPAPAGTTVEENGKIRVVGFYPDNYVEPEDSNDSSDTPAFSGIPRLVVGGDYTSSDEASYTVSVSSDSGNEPSSWPCYVTWSAHGGDSGSGRAEIRFFGDEAMIGNLGMSVRLEPSYGMSEASPFQAGWTSVEDRTWTVSRKTSRGWSDCSVNANTQFGDYTLVLSGYPNRQKNEIKFHVPENVYDLTSMSDAIGSVITIDGQDFVFTNVNGDGTEGHEDAIKVLKGGTPYESMVALSMECDTAIYDELLKQVLCFGEVAGSDPVNSNSDQVWFAVVFDEATGESLSSGIGGRSVSKIDEPYTVFGMNNGMSYKLVGSGSLKVGDSAEASVFFPVIGACYRYNIEFDNDLKKHFPPVPARSGSLMLNGVELESYHMFPGSTWADSPAVYAIGDDSIYWRDPTEGRQPWPSTYPNVDVEDEYRLLFHFVSEFHSETGPVTSLHPAVDSPITIKRCGTTDDATVGDLELDVDLSLGISDMNVEGYKAVKATRSGKLLLGPLVEKIVAGPGISISKRSGMPDGQGTVTISADGAQYAGDFETVALENAKLESIGMFPYVRFLKWTPGSGSNIPTGFVAKFHVPATAEYGVYRVKFYATVFGEESFDGNDVPLTAGIKMDYNILPDYNSVNGGLVENANLKTGLIKPDEPFVLNVPFGTMGNDGFYRYTAYDPLLIHNDSSIDPLLGKSVQVMDHAFPTKDDCKSYFDANMLSGTVFGIKPGYTVSVRFSRSDPDSGTPYTGAVGILNLRWEIEKVVDIDVSSDDEVADLVTQTVLNLRKAAAKTSRMANSYDLVTILTRMINALK